MPKTRNALTEKQRLFTEEYPVDLNATQAAIRSGYSELTAGQAASRLLKNVKIQDGIQESFRLRSFRTEVSQDMVLKELATIAFADMAVYVEWGPSGMTLRASEELPEAATRAVAEVSESITVGGHNTKFKLYDKIRALELLAKHLGMLVDQTKVEFDGDMSFTIEFETPYAPAVLGPLSNGNASNGAFALGPGTSEELGEEDDDG